MKIMKMAQLFFFNLQSKVIQKLKESKVIEHSTD